MNFDLTTWIADGKGNVETIGEAEYKVTVETPHTLWCPEKAEGDVTLSFDCAVDAENSAMLFLACAENWKGEEFFNGQRTGHYEDYSIGDLEIYTIGFNRTAHVTTENQPNASTANVRRVGGESNYQKYPQSKVRPDGKINLPVWKEWNQVSNLASAGEKHSGLGKYFHYDFTFEKPYIRLFVEGEEMLTVVDHKPNPLQGGYYAMRNMTPGGVYRIKNFGVKKAED
ncbi:MAG: DUF1961 family protein [Planctomycetota bacterium]|jgi:hypothetical protein